MYAVKSKSGKPLIFVNKQSCETFMRDTKKKFRDVNNDIDDLSTDIQGTIRKLKQNISDLEQKSTTLEKRLKEIEELELIQEAFIEATEDDD